MWSESSVQDLPFSWINTSLYAPASEIIGCANYLCQTLTLETTSTHLCSTWIYNIGYNQQQELFKLGSFHLLYKRMMKQRIFFQKIVWELNEHPLLNDNTMFPNKVKPFFILSKLSHVKSISPSRTLTEKYLQCCSVTLS